MPHGDRSNAVIEPYLTDQWYVDAKKLAQPAIEVVRAGQTKFVPSQWEATFFNWMDNIQPWCISRQIWWGHQIPAWYGPKRSEFGFEFEKNEVFVEQTESDAISAAANYYKSQIVIVASEREAFDYWQSHFDFNKPLPAMPIWRDEDVLDTWFSSALWPFSTWFCGGIWEVGLSNAVRPKTAWINP